MNRVLISIGPLNIYWYSVIILVAVLVAIYISITESKRLGISNYIENLFFSVLILGIIGARLYYVIFNFQIYKNDLLSIFKIWEGGLAIYGGIIGGFIAIMINAKKNNYSIIETTDIIVPGLILAQAIGRWGNFFNSEAYGTEVALSFLQKLHLPSFIIDGMYINGTYHHPTFLYESVWCILGFIVLLIIRRLSRNKKNILTYIYLIWYGIGRVLIEGIRTDSLYIGTYRVSQIVSIILIIIGLFGILIQFAKKGKNNEREI